MPQAADPQAPWSGPSTRDHYHALLDALTVIKARAEITRRTLVRTAALSPLDLLAHLDQIVERADRAAALLQALPTPPGTAP